MAGSFIEASISPAFSEIRSAFSTSQMPVQVKPPPASTGSKTDQVICANRIKIRRKVGAIVPQSALFTDGLPDSLLQSGASRKSASS